VVAGPLVSQPLLCEVRGVLVWLPVAARLRDGALVTLLLVALAVAALALPALLLALPALVAVPQVAVLLAALRVVCLLATPGFVALVVGLLRARMLLRLVRLLVLLRLVVSLSVPLGSLLTPVLILRPVVGRTPELPVALAPVFVPSVQPLATLLLATLAPIPLLSSRLLVLRLVPGRASVLAPLLVTGLSLVVAATSLMGLLRGGALPRLVALVGLLGVVTVLLALVALLVVAPRRSGVAASGALVTAPVALLSLLVPTVVLLVLLLVLLVPARLVVLLRLLVGGWAVVL
jgi:hypothetical protein